MYSPKILSKVVMTSLNMFVCVGGGEEGREGMRGLQGAICHRPIF